MRGFAARQMINNDIFYLSLAATCTEIYSAYVLHVNTIYTFEFTVPLVREARLFHLYIQAASKRVQTSRRIRFGKRIGETFLRDSGSLSSLIFGHRGSEGTRKEFREPLASFLSARVECYFETPLYVVTLLVRGPG